MAFVSVVEDDAAVRELIMCTLQSAGFDVHVYACGEDMLREYEDCEKPQAILLDITLPGIDGFETFRRLRDKEDFGVPVIFLTARTTEVDKVSGLNLGADDYMTKPFGVLELIARVNAVIRRAGRQPGKPEVQRMEHGGLVMDTTGHILYVDGVKTELTYKEFEMLRYFMKNAGIVLTREMLLNKIWGIEADIETRTVDMHIKTLRKKLGRCGEYIKTIRGVGYRFEV
ncbi:MAG: response regulator transcription factor [Christensenella sp.]|uniref:response regulator transcription factor n=1 Tax=Christensenella sp. TaxID=1935934 RepID=UPI002B1EB5D0|nr:response regulator transcription factor [Christensenella sp.]MEA5002256.1 response regulator transcription factor [Christensenella sp.]